MQDIVRRLVWPFLGPEGYTRVRYYKWLAFSYAPRLVTSRSREVLPVVEGFGRGGSPGLVNALAKVNTLAPTRMCLVMTAEGSDKGHLNHTYTSIYSALFSGFADRPLRILEIGLGSANPTMQFNMGAHGRPGASLRGWRELFPKASVFGADIDRNSLFREDRIETFYCDQLDPAAIREMWSQEALREPMDIIIDDGLHTFEGNVTFLDASLDRLAPGGTFVIEDVFTNVLPKWREELATRYTAQFPDHEMALVQLPNPHNDYSNNQVIFRAPGA